MEEVSRMILGGRRVSDPPLQGAAMVGHFGYIKCGAGQTLRGVTHVFGPNVIYVPGLYPSQPSPIKGEGITRKGPHWQFSQPTLPVF